ncbi:MAG TPA: DNA polymerase IV [Candidatus Eisenbacteria bacterium]|nr:DNA polymerase IV [Candidatus Eisenbacteria bacterium]
MILLVDMDAFFASVEQLHHPNLRGQPVVVCGDPGRRGVVTAASYEARPFGIRAGMPLQEARRLCPQAQYIEGNPEKYVALSLRILDFYLEFTPDVEPFSVDEAFLSMASTLDLATEIGREIQTQIDRRFGLGATIGIGPNKLIAKMASGVRKPRGLTAMTPEQFREYFWPREVRELWGVGEKLQGRLETLGIATVGDLARAKAADLEAAFGVIGPQLREAASGYDDTPLIPYHHGVDPKSMGHEVTLSSDTDDAEYLRGVLLRLSDQVARRLRNEKFRGRTVAIKLRDKRFITHLRQTTLREYTDDHRVIFEHVSRNFDFLWKGGSVRLLGVSVSHLERRENVSQSELFTSHAREGRLQDALDQVRDRLGEASLIPAGAMTGRSRLSHVPFGAISSRAMAPRTRRSDSAEG